MKTMWVRPVMRSTQSGLSMVEILVTLTIVAFGLLGLLGLQARALTFQKDSFDRKSAAEMVTQLAERMRANHLGFTAGDYDLISVLRQRTQLRSTSARPSRLALGRSRYARP